MESIEVEVCVESGKSDRQGRRIRGAAELSSILERSTLTQDHPWLIGLRRMGPDQKKGKTTQGYLWVIGKPRSDVVFDWRLSRKHDEATSLLDGFEGVLQSDGYGAPLAVCQGQVKLND